MSDDRKLDYIKHGKVPIKHTGIANTDFVLQSWKRQQENIIYDCSICDSKIQPNDYMHEVTQRGMLIERKQPDLLGNPQPSKFPWEVLGFVCKKCFDESAEYDNLYYG